MSVAVDLGNAVRTGGKLTGAVIGVGIGTVLSVLDGVFRGLALQAAARDRVARERREAAARRARVVELWWAG